MVLKVVPVSVLFLFVFICVGGGGEEACHMPLGHYKNVNLIAGTCRYLFPQNSAFYLVIFLIKFILKTFDTINKSKSGDFDLKKNGLILSLVSLVTSAVLLISRYVIHAHIGSTCFIFTTSGS